jgi:hypothetical protein
MNDIYDSVQLIIVVWNVVTSNAVKPELFKY